MIFPTQASVEIELMPFLDDAHAGIKTQAENTQRALNWKKDEEQEVILNTLAQYVAGTSHFIADPHEDRQVFFQRVTEFKKVLYHAFLVLSFRYPRNAIDNEGRAIDIITVAPIPASKLFVSFDRRLWNVAGLQRWFKTSTRNPSTNQPFSQQELLRIIKIGTNGSQYRNLQAKLRLLESKKSTDLKIGINYINQQRELLMSGFHAPFFIKMLEHVKHTDEEIVESVLRLTDYFLKNTTGFTHTTNKNIIRKQVHFIFRLLTTKNVLTNLLHYAFLVLIAISEDHPQT